MRDLISIVRFAEITRLSIKALEETLMCRTEVQWPIRIARQSPAPLARNES